MLAVADEASLVLFDLLEPAPEVLLVGVGERLQRFLPPEDVWLRGPSPIDLQRQVALRRPPGVALSWVQNL